MTCLFFTLLHQNVKYFKQWLDNYDTFRMKRVWAYKYFKKPEDCWIRFLIFNSDQPKRALSNVIDSIFWYPLIFSFVIWQNSKICKFHNIRSLENGSVQRVTPVNCNSFKKNVFDRRNIIFRSKSTSLFTRLVIIESTENIQQLNLYFYFLNKDS